VRLSSERVDDRALALDAPWFDAGGEDCGSDSDAEDESEADEGADEAGLDGSVSEEDDNDVGEDEDEDEDKEAEEDEDDDEVPLKPRSSFARKRKRPSPPSAPSLEAQLDPTRPRKKVAFAASVKATTNSTRSSKEYSATTRPSRSKKSNAKVPISASHIPARTPAHARKPAANAPTTTTAQKRKAAAAGENDAYDFSKFF
jgi:hypothetical protein